MTDNSIDSKKSSQNISNRIEVIESPRNKSGLRKHQSKHTGKKESKDRHNSNLSNDEIELIYNVGSQDETITIEIGEDSTSKSTSYSSSADKNTKKSKKNRGTANPKSSDTTKQKRKDSDASSRSNSTNKSQNSTLSESSSTLTEGSSSSSNKSKKSRSVHLSESQHASSQSSRSSKKSSRSGKKGKTVDHEDQHPQSHGSGDSASSTTLSQMQDESWHSKDVHSIATLQKNSKIESKKNRKQNQTSSDISSDLLGSTSSNASSTLSGIDLSNVEHEQWKPKHVKAINNLTQAPGSRSNFISSSDFTDQSKIKSQVGTSILSGNSSSKGKSSSFKGRNKKGKQFVINSESSSSAKPSESDHVYDSDGSKGLNEPLESPVQKRYKQKVDNVYSTEPLVSPAKGRGLRVRKMESDKDPEMGRLTLPSEGEFQPDSEISDLGVEFDTYKTKYVRVISNDGNEIKRKRKPISKIDDTSSFADDNSFANSSNLYTRDVEINQSSLSIPSAMMETNQDSSNLFAIEEGDSENQGQFLLQFEKNAELLSSSESGKEEEEVHEDKFVSKKGITLFMLSSSDYIEEEETDSSDDEKPIHPQSSVFFSSESGVSHEEKQQKTRNKYSGEMIVCLTVIEAIGLPTLSVIRKDPYCTVNIKGKREVQSTKVITNNTSPIWNSQFSFNLKNNKDLFAFNVKYADTFGGDTDVAYAEFCADGLKIGQVIEKTIPLRLYDNDGIPIYQPNPQLHFSILLKPKPMPTQPVDVSQRPTPKSPTTPSFVSRGISDIEHFDNEINSTITVIEARHLENPSNETHKLESYCTINVLGRNDLKRTMSVPGTTSPIWNKQFKYVLENKQVTLLFNIVLEDKRLGDLRIAYAKVPINDCTFNQFNNMWVPLRSTSSTKREKIDSILDPSASYLLHMDETNEEEENAGELHISIVLEPKMTEMPFSPRPHIGANSDVFDETPTQYQLNSPNPMKFRSSPFSSTNNSEIETKSQIENNNNYSSEDQSPSILSYSENNGKVRSDALDPLDEISTLSGSGKNLNSHASNSNAINIDSDSGNEEESNSNQGEQESTEKWI